MAERARGALLRHVVFMEALARWDLVTAAESADPLLSQTDKQSVRAHRRGRGAARDPLSRLWGRPEDTLAPFLADLLQQLGRAPSGRRRDLGQDLLHGTTVDAAIPTTECESRDAVRFVHEGPDGPSCGRH
jgi:hypothetical protein